MSETRQWDRFVRETLEAGALLQASFSNPRVKAADRPHKLTVRPVRLKSGLHYQFERFAGAKAFHDNVPAAEAVDALVAAMDDYRQALVKTPEADVQALAGKKGGITLLHKPPTSKAPAAESAAQSHNRTKSYVLPEGEPAAFLVRLGVMSPEGRVLKGKHDKFRQINRFLETVADVLPELPEGRELTVVDFGCGKSYLTFALYHWLAVRERKEVRIVGLDLKADVIEACSRLARELGWDKLTFEVGDIAGYAGLEAADMVVALHACDTATDAALVQAVRWNASVILSVPCCQHELFGQLSQPILKPLLKHGILKERFSALVTDAVRANLLELAGYRTQVLEFIDMEHTPKNVLIRAVKSKTRVPERSQEDYERLRDFLGVTPFMESEISKFLLK